MAFFAQFDVLILGGGPSGTATAIAVGQRNRRAILIETTNYTAWRVGETLPAAAKTLLAQLAIDTTGLQNVTLASQAIESSWGARELHEQHSIANPYGTGLHLDRRRFDILLAFEAERFGVTVLRRSRLLSLHPHPAGFLARIQTPLGTQQIETKLVVDATGRSAALARSQGARYVEFDRLIGLTGILTPCLRHAHIAPTLLLEASELGWWYSVPLPGGSLLITYMSDVDLLPASRSRLTKYWLMRLQETVHTSKRAKGFVLPGKVHVKKASTGILSTVAGLNWLAVGDAAMTYDPLSSNGIRKALQGGLRAAQAIDDFLKEGAPDAMNNYSRYLVSEFGRYMEQRVDYYEIERRWPKSIFWRRRQPFELRSPPITLDPHLLLRGQKGSIAHTASELESFIPYRELKRMHRLSMDMPQEAHILLRRFLSTSPIHLSHRYAIIALQQFMACGLVISSA